MTDLVHPTAIIDPGARLGPRVRVGPYAIVGPRVTLDEGVAIAAHAVLEQDVRVGRDTRIGVGAVIGGEPQDLKYDNEPTRVEIGADCVIREYVTVNRGTAATGLTTVGDRCFLMAYAHVGHDCVLEDDVILANAVQLGGHVHLEAQVSIGGSTAIHQFARIGTYAFVGGGSRVAQDVPPYAKAAGSPLKMYGINAVGLRRSGLSRDCRMALKRAFRLLFNSDMTTSEAIEFLRAEGTTHTEVERLLDFFGTTERGVLV